MLFDPEKTGDRCGQLIETVRSAQGVTPELVAEIIAVACDRFPLLNKGGKEAARIAQLIQDSAWVDLGLTLIALELPGWTLRRLTYDGAWYCSLSRQANMPIEFDDTIDVSHEIMPLAILCALLEARRTLQELQQTAQTSAPQISPTLSHSVCCDNFA